MYFPIYLGLLFNVLHSCQFYSTVVTFISKDFSHFVEVFYMWRAISLRLLLRFSFNSWILLCLCVDCFKITALGIYDSCWVQRLLVFHQIWEKWSHCFFNFLLPPSLSPLLLRSPFMPVLKRLAASRGLGVPSPLFSLLSTFRSRQSHMNNLIFFLCAKDCINFCLVNF